MEQYMNYPQRTLLVYWQAHSSLFRMD